MSHRDAELRGCLRLRPGSAQAHAALGVATVFAAWALLATGAGLGQDAGEKKTTAEGLRNAQVQPPVVGLGAGERIRKHYVAMAMKTPKAVLLKQIERDLEVAKGWSDPAREDGKFAWEKTKIS